MIELNNKSIFVGQIKQVLKDFNLPSCIVGSDDKAPDMHYIDNDGIYYNSTDDNGNTTSIRVDDYYYNRKIQNITRNFEVNNMIYDRTTHRCLGDYLRFQRDSRGIDLMSLYNCFDGEVNSIDTDIELSDGSAIEFHGTEKGYVVYSIPAGIHDYTILIRHSLPIEMCVSLDIRRNTNIDEEYSSLNKSTYVKRCMNHGFTFDKLTRLKEDDEMHAFISKYSRNLRLLIKVPQSYSSSITVLEGDYSNYFNQSKDMDFFTYQVDNKTISTGFSSNIQLFSYENAEKSYLLADKLVEYLTGNAITKNSKSYDIEKLQMALMSNGLVSADYLGVWSEQDTYALQEFIMRGEKDKQKQLNCKFDVLPYGDKEVENKLGGII